MSAENDLRQVWHKLEALEADWSRAVPYTSAGRGTQQQFDSHGRDAAGGRTRTWFMGDLDDLGERVARVREALDMAPELAYEMICSRFAGLDLSAIWPLLRGIVKDIALYAGGGALAGGAVGFVFGGGVGAVPGAIVGGNVGLWALNVIGLASLAKELANVLPDALKHYVSGVQEAWGPAPQRTRRSGMGDTGTTAGDFLAAHQIARGHVLLVTALLLAIMAYVTKGGASKAALLKEISHAPRLGPRVAAWAEANEGKFATHMAMMENQGRRRAGSAAAGSGEARTPSQAAGRRQSESPVAKPQPRVIRNLNDVELKQWLRDNHKITDEAVLNDMVKAFDPKKPIQMVELPQGTEVIQYVRDGGKVGNFYAYPGTPPSQLAISGEGRTLAPFVVNEPIQAIQGTAASFPVGKYPGVGGEGGGLQILVPKGTNIPGGG